MCAQPLFFVGVSVWCIGACMSRVCSMVYCARWVVQSDNCLHFNLFVLFLNACSGFLLRVSCPFC